MWMFNRRKTWVSEKESVSIRDKFSAMSPKSIWISSIQKKTQNHYVFGFNENLFFPKKSADDACLRTEVYSINFTNTSITKQRKIIIPKCLILCQLQTILLDYKLYAASAINLINSSNVSNIYKRHSTNNLCLEWM